MKLPPDLPPDAESVINSFTNLGIDRRTAFKSLLALNIGVPTVLALLATDEARAQTNVDLDALRAVSQRSSSRLFQLTFLADLQANEQERNAFMADPVEYTRGRGITFDPFLLREIIDTTLLFRPLDTSSPSPFAMAMIMESLRGDNQLSSAYSRLQATPTANTLAVAAVAVAAVAVAGVMAYNAYTMTSHTDHFDEILRSNSHLLPGGGTFDERPDER